MKVLVFAFLLLFFAHLTTAQEVPLQTGPRERIQSVNFSPDDRYLLTYADGKLYLWDVKSGHLLWRAETWFIQKSREPYDLRECAWSQDEKFVVTKSANGTYQTWEADTGKILTVTGHAPNFALTPAQAMTAAPSAGVLSHDGKFQAFVLQAENLGGGNDAIKIKDRQTGKTWLLRAHPGAISAIAYSPDGRYFAVAGSDANIYIFEAKTRQLVQTLVGHTSPHLSLVFSQDGKRLLSRAGNGWRKTWDWQAGQLLQDVKAPGDDAGSAQFSADGKYALRVEDTTRFSLWDAQQGSRLREFKIEKNYSHTSGEMTVTYDHLPVLSVAFNQLGNRILSSHADRTLRLWNPEGQQRGGIAVREGIELARLSPDERTILTLTSEGVKRKLRLYDARAGKEHMRFDDWKVDFIQALAFSPDGEHFATLGNSGDLLLWAVKQARPLHELNPHDWWGRTALAFSPDGKTLAAGGENQNVFLFDVQTGKTLWQLLPSHQPTELETRLIAERRQRASALEAKLAAAKAQRDRQAAIDTQRFKNQVYLTFEHYGNMTDTLDERLLSSGEPDKSLAKKAAAEANAVWLRLHNDAPLPLQVTTLSSYWGKSPCYHEFAPGVRVEGVCDGREISIQFDVRDRQRKPVRYGIDVVGHATILPHTSVWFAVPRAFWQTGHDVRFAVTFQKETIENKIADYGKPILLRVRMKE